MCYCFYWKMRCLWVICDFFFLFLVGFSKPDAELVFASIAESDAFGSFLVFFLCRVAFSKPPIGLSDPRTSFSLTLMPLGFIASSCCCVPTKS